VGSIGTPLGHSGRLGFLCRLPGFCLLFSLGGLPPWFFSRLWEDEAGKHRPRWFFFPFDRPWAHPPFLLERFESWFPPSLRMLAFLHVKLASTALRFSFLGVLLGDPLLPFRSSRGTDVQFFCVKHFFCLSSPYTSVVASLFGTLQAAWLGFFPVL